jgi:preprotein translocase subunit YajC
MITNKEYLEHLIKVGDILTKDGKKGKVTKISDTQATVDFGNGDVYGIAHSRIKGKKIVK